MYIIPKDSAESLDGAAEAPEGADGKGGGWVKVIPLTDQQSAQFAVLIQAVRDARKAQAEAFRNEQEADKNLHAAVEAIHKHGRLSEDGKYMVTWDEAELFR